MDHSLDRMIATTTSRWFFDPTSEQLYHRVDSTSWEYMAKAPIQSGRLALAKFLERTPSANPPAPLFRATVEQHRCYTCLTGFSATPETPIVPSRGAESLQSMIQDLDPNTSWAVQGFLASDNGLTIAEALKAGTAIAVSDGSYKEGVATASWVLEGRNSSILPHCIFFTGAIPEL